MKKLLSIVMMFVLVLSFVDFADAKSTTPRSSSSSSKSYSKPSVSKPAPKVTVKKTITKPKASVKKAVDKKPVAKKPVVKKTVKPKKKKKHYSSLYYHNGSFSKYLVTSAGLYLLLHDTEEDGDPIYVYAESGEEVDDDDLEDLGVTTVESIPESKVKSAKSESSTMFWFGVLFGTLAFIISLIVIVMYLVRRN